MVWLKHALAPFVLFLGCAGRSSGRISADDGGGGAYLNFIQEKVGIDAFIDVNVDRTAAASVPGGCTILCFPRVVTLEIGYHQRTERLKRIIFVNMIFSEFDKDPTVTTYKLKLSTLPHTAS